VQVGLGNRGEQTVLAAEVAYDERSIDACLSGNLPDRRPLVPLFGEQPSRGLFDRRSGPV